MFKLLVSNESAGTFEVKYMEANGGTEVVLCGIDFSGATLNIKQKEWFLQKMPVVYNEAAIKEAFAGAPLIFIREDYAPDFDVDFWNKYGKKVNRERCERTWSRLTKADKALAVGRLNEYLRHLSISKWKNKADPNTYLHEKYYLTNWTKVMD